MQSRIMADDHQGMRQGRRLFDDGEDGVRGRIIKPLDRLCGRRRAQGGRGEFPCLLGALGGRYHDAIWDQGMGRDKRADHSGVIFAAFGQGTGAVLHPGFRLFGLGVAKQ